MGKSKRKRCHREEGEAMPEESADDGDVVLKKKKRKRKKHADVEGEAMSEESADDGDVVLKKKRKKRKKHADVDGEAMPEESADDGDVVLKTKKRKRKKRADVKGEAMPEESADDGDVVLKKKKRKRKKHADVEGEAMPEESTDDGDVVLKKKKKKRKKHADVDGVDIPAEPHEVLGWILPIKEKKRDRHDVEGPASAQKHAECEQMVDGVVIGELVPVNEESESRRKKRKKHKKKRRPENYETKEEDEALMDKDLFSVRPQQSGIELNKGGPHESIMLDHKCREREHISGKSTLDSGSMEVNPVYLRKKRKRDVAVLSSVENDQHRVKLCERSMEEECSYAVDSAEDKDGIGEEEEALIDKGLFSVRYQQNKIKLNEDRPHKGNTQDHKCMETGHLPGKSSTVDGKSVKANPVHSDRKRKQDLDVSSPVKNDKCRVKLCGESTGMNSMESNADGEMSSSDSARTKHRKKKRKGTKLDSTQHPCELSIPRDSHNTGLSENELSSDIALLTPVSELEPQPQLRIKRATQANNRSQNTKAAANAAVDSDSDSESDLKMSGQFCRRERPRTKHWTKVEDKQLRRNWKSYLKKHPLKNPYCLLNAKFGERDRVWIHNHKKETSFSELLGKGINRKPNGIICRARRLFNPLRKNQIEDENLDLVVEMHKSGQSIMNIAEEFEVSNERADILCRTRARCHKAEKKGPWTANEEKLVVNTMIDLIGELPLDNVPWNCVAEKIPGRTDWQCRRHWINTLYWKTVHKRTRRRFDKKTYLRLVNGVQNFGVESEIDIDWSQIGKKLDADIPSIAFLKEKWTMLKAKYDVKGLNIAENCAVLKKRIKFEFGKKKSR